MNIKSVLLASTVAFAGISGAQAADAIVYEEPIAVVAAPVFSWTGAYLGGQIGYGWGKSKFGAYDVEDDIYSQFNIKPDGFIGGLYAGYNFDTGSNFIFGVDGDVTYNGLKDDLSDNDGEGLDGSVETKLRWSGAVRARAGYAIDRFMPYIAGGVAFGNVKNTVSLTDVSSGDRFSTSESKTHTGWTIGAGADYAATDNLILRLEYRYTDYGKKNTDFGDTSIDTERNKFKTNELRLGVAYKF